MKINWIINGILVIVGFLLLNCNPKVEIPAYIYVENVSFSAKNEQGTSSAKIPDIWVAVNGKSIGVYQLPALFPVIAEGGTQLWIEAGIKLDGLSQQRPKYPFYSMYKENINLTKGKIDTIVPEFRYLDSLKFPLIEDFESAGLKFSSVPNSAELKKTNDNNLIFHNGNEPNTYSGIIELPTADDISFFEIKTTSALWLNSYSATYCFVELNFCFTENVEIGMYCYYKSSSPRQIALTNIIGKENNTEWNKIYVNLTKEMGDATAAGMTHFEVYMKSGIPKGKTARYLFDNIKLIHQ